MVTIAVVEVFGAVAVTLRLVVIARTQRAAAAAIQVSAVEVRTTPGC